jgi:hypothetical protein
VIHVRRYRRVTVTGRTVSVRAHEREGGDGMVPVPEWSRPAYVGDLTPVADGQGTSPEFRDLFLDDEDCRDDEPVMACPECGEVYPVDLGGTLAPHRLPGEVNYCPGSGTKCQ